MKPTPFAAGVRTGVLPVGFAVTPAKDTSRVWTLMKNRTSKRRRHSVSTVNKSHATAAWRCKNSLVGGLRLRRVGGCVQCLVVRRRCHRSSVSGVTIQPCRSPAIRSSAFSFSNCFKRARSSMLPTFGLAPFGLVLVHPVPQGPSMDPEIVSYRGDRLARLSDNPHRALTELRVVLRSHLSMTSPRSGCLHGSRGCPPRATTRPRRPPAHRTAPRPTHPHQPGQNRTPHRRTHHRTPPGGGVPLKLRFGL